MKRVLSMIKVALVAVSAMLGSIALTPAASAQEASTYNNDSGGCNNSCMPTMNGGTVSLEVLGMNFGEGLAGAEADGDTVETFAGVLKTGTLNLDGGIYGSNDGCEVDCGSFGAWFNAEGNEHVLSEAGAIATGSNSAFAGVGNSAMAGIAFTGNISFGTTPSNDD